MSTSRRLLLDTHALLWWKAESDRIPGTVVDAIEAADSLLISPITCWEISMLVEKKRVEFDRPTSAWVNDLLAESAVEIAELTSAIAVDAGSLLGLHGDPADRMIFATARALGCPLVTKDSRLTDFAEHNGDVVVVWG